MCFPQLSALEPDSGHPSRRKDQEVEKRGSKEDPALTKSNKWKEKSKLLPPTFMETFRDLLPLSRARLVSSALGAILSRHSDSILSPEPRSGDRQYWNVWVRLWWIKPYWWTWIFQFLIIPHITKYCTHFYLFSNHLKMLKLSTCVAELVALDSWFQLWSQPQGCGVELLVGLCAGCGACLRFCLSPCPSSIPHALAK